MEEVGAPAAEGGGWSEVEEWEQACMEVVKVLDEGAMPHALSEALWVQPPDFSNLLTGFPACS